MHKIRKNLSRIDKNDGASLTKIKCGATHGALLELLLVTFLEAQRLSLNTD